MINAAIFLLHGIFLVVVFFLKWKQEGSGGALVNLGLISLLFFAGWTLTNFIAALIFPPEGFGKELNLNTLSLLLLTVIETPFYLWYYKDLLKANSDESERQ